MQVSELDLAEFPHSYVRKRRMTCGNRTICCGNAPIVRNFRTIDGGISAPYTAESARYDADNFLFFIQLFAVRLWSMTSSTIKTYLKTYLKRKEDKDKNDEEEKRLKFFESLNDTTNFLF